MRNGQDGIEMFEEMERGRNLYCVTVDVLAKLTPRRPHPRALRLAIEGLQARSCGESDVRALKTASDRPPQEVPCLWGRCHMTSMHVGQSPTLNCNPL